MNVFQIIGDSLHILAIILLLVKILRTKSCAGVSGRSQILFAAVYTTRYFDLAYVYISLYNTIMKIFIIASTYLTVLLIFSVYRKTYQPKRDIFLTEVLIIPSFLMAMWINHDFTSVEIFWTLSTYLEAVAILPQFYMIYKKKQLEKSMFFYLLALGLYKGFYIFNWIYRYFNECHFDVVADGAGLLYTFLYIAATAEVLFNGIKITAEEKGTFLKRNIFFISNNDELNEHVNLTDEQADSDKIDFINPPTVPQVYKV